ncbi:hypothetical protein [Nocardia altamirensis]|uniref:hypothetical protein n=1 Tax=Nocardia altamirensis TaxID=472158 RepID=UPI0008406A33|nr:hypothetical protein [Nocardia altamirensis]
MGFNWWREAGPDGTSAQEIVDRVQAEWRAERRRNRAKGDHPADTSMWPQGWPHEAPDYDLGVLEAHKIMQQHRDCRADTCPRKATARRALIAAGRMKPDTSREY